MWWKGWSCTQTNGSPSKAAQLESRRDLLGYVHIHFYRPARLLLLPKPPFADNDASAKLRGGGSRGRKSCVKLERNPENSDPWKVMKKVNNALG